ALKFFGFTLKQIKQLLLANVSMIEHFSAQSQFLEEKAKKLNAASKTLKGIIVDCEYNKSIPWETILQLIEVYHMKQQLENTWAGKVLSSSELEDYASFEQELKSRYSSDEKEAFKKSWADLARKIMANLHQDPTSPFGIDIAKQCM